MTLRQYYAGLAMQGLCAGISGEMAGSDGGESLVNLSVKIADNLIKELNKPE
jgi:hypothetical protein